MRAWLSIATAIAFTIGLSAGAEDAATPAAQTAHALSFAGLEGGDLPLSAYAGDVVLVVNTATRCGLTNDQYPGLQALQDQYAGSGLVVLGVPSADFGNQTPEDESGVKDFCETHFDAPITFPHTGKAHVIGADAHAFYKWAEAALGDAAVPRWNFHKILVARDGRALAAFNSRIRPSSRRLTGAIEIALAEDAPAVKAMAPRDAPAAEDAAEESADQG